MLTKTFTENYSGLTVHFNEVISLRVFISSSCEYAVKPLKMMGCQNKTTIPPAKRAKGSISIRNFMSKCILVCTLHSYGVKLHTCIENNTKLFSVWRESGSYI